MMAVAVKCFEVDCTLKMVRASTGLADARSVTPNPSVQTVLPWCTRATAPPGTPSLPIASWIDLRLPSINCCRSFWAARLLVPAATSEAADPARNDRRESEMRPRDMDLSIVDVQTD